MPQGPANINKRFVCLRCIFRQRHLSSRRNLTSIAQGGRNGREEFHGLRTAPASLKRDELPSEAGNHARKLTRSSPVHVSPDRRQSRSVNTRTTALASNPSRQPSKGFQWKRGLSSSSVSSSQPTLPRPESLKSGTARLTDKTLLAVYGEDTAHFLQGITTNNITSAQASGQASTPPSEEEQREPKGQDREISTSGEDDGFAERLVPHSTIRQAFPSAFLNAQGRLLHDVFIYPCAHSPLLYSHFPPPERDVFVQGRQQAFLIEVDVAEAGLLRKHLMRYRLRAKVNVKIVDPEKVGVFVLWGPQPRDQIIQRLRGRHVDIQTVEDAMTSKDEMIGCSDPRAPGLGVRAILPLTSESTASSTLFTDQPSPPNHPDPALPSYTLHRILHGIPDPSSPGTSLPHEQDMDITSHIDFRKGCYVGQELTIRTQHSGVVRKRVLPVQLYLSRTDTSDQQMGSPPTPKLDVTQETPGYDPSSPDLASLVSPGADIIPHAVKRGRPAGKWIGGMGNVGLALCRVEMMTDLVVSEAEAAESGSRWRAGREFRVKGGGSGEGGGGGHGTAALEELGGREICVKAFVPGWMRERVRPKGVGLRV